MRRLLTVLAIALSCIYLKVSGTLVKVVVKPGDNAILHCDRQIIEGQDIQWVKICSAQIQPPLIISAYNTLLFPYPRFSLSWNNTSKSHDLEIENITEADLGLYYCTRVEKKRIEHNRMIFEREVYHLGETLTKLTYGASSDPKHLDSSACSLNVSSGTHSDPNCHCWQCWLILQTMCPACSLLSAMLAFVCGYKCCHKTVLKQFEGLPSSFEMQRQQNQEQDVHADIYYASLNIPKRGSKLAKSKRLPNSDYSVYNDIKMHC
ncbi:uncharacterized protein LOC127626506 isoform X1 [Xyrauchen texanus]|uniref:uncharacterized protein LOC127626506 isoform X1 n=1 Tax=Xyrauchen texanus TaxID=154827 RepID=UPI002241A162|nr:uncharacterized protein LOC127626506 isoform X1 [Xyrauchen texanus]